jgi:hypothetical protein
MYSFLSNALDLVRENIFELLRLLKAARQIGCESLLLLVQ